MSLSDRFFKFRETSHSETAKPFIDHLEDLRWTLVRMGMVLGVSMAGCFLFRSQLMALIQQPLNAVDPTLASRLISLGVADSMTISFQVAFYAGIVISFPILLYFLAGFVLPALTLQEKKYLFPSIALGFILFLTGVLFCFLIILPSTLEFFFKDAQSLQWTPTWTVREYFSFVTQMVLAFGLAFELPVAVMALVYMGFLGFNFLNATRAYAVIIIMFLAAIITPTSDIITLLALGAPMCLLYEICIWLAWLMERRGRHI